MSLSVLQREHFETILRGERRQKGGKKEAGAEGGGGGGEKGGRGEKKVNKKCRREIE